MNDKNTKILEWIMFALSFLGDLFGRIFGNKNSGDNLRLGV